MRILGFIWLQVWAISFVFSPFSCSNSIPFSSVFGLFEWLHLDSMAWFLGSPKMVATFVSCILLSLLWFNSYPPLLCVFWLLVSFSCSVLGFQYVAQLSLSWLNLGIGFVVLCYWLGWMMMLLFCELLFCVGKLGMPVVHLTTWVSHKRGLPLNLCICIYHSKFVTNKIKSFFV